MSAYKREFPLYAIGLGCVLAGAWLNEVSGSLIPLALGASASLMCTFRVVKRIRARAASRRA